MRVERSCNIDASREEVWETVSNPENWLRLIHGISRFEPQGDKKERKGDDDEPVDRLGERYHLRLHVGSADIGGLVEIVEFDEPGDLAWTSITGIDHRGRWRVREAADGRTKVTFRLSYQAPGGVLGNVIAPGDSKTLGTIIGAGGGALLGREIDRGDIVCR